MPEIKNMTRSRIESIDILRGIIMVVMALDHTRDFFHKTVLADGSSVALNPTDMATTTPLLFFTRWITHFCAPLFFFLAGLSAWLMIQKKTKAAVSEFLLKRGFFLVLVEVIIVNFGWTFNPFYNTVILQVIWAIGISMIILGLLIHLPFKVLLATGLIIVVGHNLMDFPSISKDLQGGFIPDLIYFSRFSMHSFAPGHSFLIVYAFLPWTGVMILGYCFGKIYRAGIDAVRRKKILLWTGSGLLMLFILLRIINLYGDPAPWHSQPRGMVFTFLSFFNVTKYPPSLQFLSLTIGAGLILLAVLEGVRNKLTGFFMVYGRVPLFYYILHFYILHILVVITFFAEGYKTDQIVTPAAPFYFRPPDFGFGLLPLYAIWIFVVLVLFPICKKYDRYKSQHRHWWLSYL